MNHRCRSALLPLALSAALVLSGCASPYVVLERNPEVAGTRPPVLADAIRDARHVQSQYRTKVIEFGESERSLSNGLMGLGTLILGLGVAKTHASAINGVVLGTGAVYTIGTANTDRRRAQIYLAGMKSLDCAVAAVVPLVLSEDHLEQLKAERTAVSAAVPGLTSAMGEAERWAALARIADAAKFKEPLDAVQLALPAAQAAVGQADESVDLATQRLSKPDQMAKELRGAVSAIDRAVLDELRGTENAVQAVPGILAGLQSNATLFSLQALAPAAAPAASPGGNAGADNVAAHAAAGGAKAGTPSVENVAAHERAVANGLATALGHLRARTVAVASLAQRLNRAANSNAQAASDALKGCQVDAVVKPITVTPSTVALTAKKAVVSSVLVDGGNGNFTAGFLQTPTPGLTAVIRPRSKGVVDVVATDQTVAGGSYQLVIEDTTQRSRAVVTVTVAAADATTTPPATQDKQKQAAELVINAKTVALENGDKVSIASAVPAGDGIEVTYQVPAGRTVDPKAVEKAILDMPGVVALLGSAASNVKAAEVPGARSGKGGDKKPVKADSKPPAARSKPVDAGPLVSRLSPADIKALQERMCMAPSAATGRWDAATQAALEADRRVRNGPAPAPGSPFEEPERKMLMSLTDAVAVQRCKNR